MPIEIMELVVKATISEEQAQKNENPVLKQMGKTLDKQALTEEIIEQILHILKQQKER